MADDNNPQHRLGNPQNRTPMPGEQASDPLAELARLIGQNDPYSEFGRNQQPSAANQQRTLQYEQPPAPQPAQDMPEQLAGGGPYRIVQEPQQPYAQAPNQAPHNVGVGDFREHAYRDLNQPPPSNDFYDESEPRGRGRGMMTAMAVIALALVGIVGAFGYRLVFSGPSSSAPPPVIRANTDPTKLPPTAEASQSKLADRVPDRTQDSRTVSREETPVDAKDLSRPPSARGSNAPPPNNNAWSQAAAPNLPPASSTTAAAPSAVLSEPRKVRTVPIRPDANNANLEPTSLVPPTQSAAPPPPVARQNSRANTPVAPIAPLTEASQIRPPVTMTPPQQAPGNSPLSLGDETSPALPRTSGEAAPPARQTPPQRQATNNPPQPLASAQRQAPPPAPMVSAQRQANAAPPPPQVTAAPSAGGFLVQVSSQRSEAEAQAALRSVQGKYSSVLGGQRGAVQRAELGERGTFYRAMIGPYASRDQANQVCTSLKAAGGSCIVQGN